VCSLATALTIAIGVLVIVGALLGLDALLYHPSSKIQ